MTKLLWERSVRLSAKIASRHNDNENVRTFKDASENLNPHKSTSKRIPTGILSWKIQKIVMI